MLGDRQRETLVQFLDAIAELCAPCQDQAKIGALKEKVDLALALLERDFPLSLQVKGHIACMINATCYCQKMSVKFILVSPRLDRIFCTT